MLKKIFSMLLICLFASVSAIFANEKAIEIAQTKVKTSEAANDAEVKTNKVSVNKKNEEDKMMQRAEAQIKRVSLGIELTEKQLEEAKKIFVESEAKSTELREQLNNLNKERMEKFDKLLTEEQLKAREEAKKNRNPTKIDGKGAEKSSIKSKLIEEKP